MANVTTSAETNVIKKTNVAKVRELDFATLFGENVNSLINMLGVTRKIPVTAGTVLKKLKVTGTLDTTTVVGEGEIIPLSQYATTYTAVGEITLKKWRKATTAEAILKGGYDQAVNETDAKMVLDIQKTIRSAFITALADDDATTASGATLQATLAQMWGQLQTKFEDEAVSTVYFVNPLDMADYLGSAQITMQTAFGLSYIENFLGLGTVILSSLIDKGTVYATASQNIVCYYVDVNEANGLGEAFDFTTDPQTGMVGIHEDGNYARLQEETVAVSGVTFFPEMPAGIVIGTIGEDSE